MPAQTLQKVMANARVFSEPSPFENIPDLVVRISQVLNKSAELNAQIGTLLVSLSGCSASHISRLLRTLTDDSARKTAIKVAAIGILHSDEYEVLEAILSIADKAFKDRNRIAHCMWGYSPDIPDAVLFIEQPASLQLSLDIKIYCEENFQNEPPSDLTSIEAQQKLIRFDPNQVWVYRDADISSALAAIKEILICVVLFRQHTQAKTMSGGRPTPVDRIWYNQIVVRPLIVKEMARKRQAREANK